MIKISQPIKSSEEVFIQFYSKFNYQDIVHKVKFHGGYFIKNSDDRSWRVPVPNVVDLLSDLSKIDKELVQADLSIIDSFLVGKKYDNEILKLRDCIDGVEVDLELANGNHLLPFQKVGVEFINIIKNGIIADKVGLGKTIQGLASAKLLQKNKDIDKCLVVVPGSLKKKWHRDANIFFGEKSFTLEGSPLAREGIFKEYVDSDALFGIISYDTLRADIVISEKNALTGKSTTSINKESYLIQNLPDKFCIIFDEVQYLKSIQSQRSLAGRFLSAEKGCKSKIGLTATYIETGLQDLFGLMYVIDSSVFGTNWISFTIKYLQTDFFGRIRGYKNEDIARDKMKLVSVRRSKPQVVGQMASFLPKVNENTLWVEMSNVQKKLYNEVLEGVIEKMNNMEKQRQVSAANAMTIMGLLIQASLSTELFDYEKSASIKIDTLLEILPEIVEDNKVVIFCHFVKFIDIMEREFNKAKIKCIAMHGSRTEGATKNRQPMVDKFSASKDINVLITSDILREGIDIPSATYIINVDILWNPSKMVQRNGRHDRLSQKSPNIFVYNIWAAGTIEEQIYKVVYDRYELALQVMDDGKEEDRIQRLTFNNLKSMLKRV